MSFQTKLPKVTLSSKNKLSFRYDNIDDYDDKLYEREGDLAILSFCCYASSYLCYLLSLVYYY